MNELFDKYSGNTIKTTDADLTNAFLKFYQNDHYVEDWLNTLMQQLQLKDDLQSNITRCKGNECYSQRKFQNCFQYYTRAMCKATHNGDEIGLVIANRSAVLFMTERYEDCLKDIEFSLKCKCPDNIKLKLLIRKIKCLAKLNLQKELEDAVNHAFLFQSTHPCVIDKAKITTEILSSRSTELYIKQTLAESLGEIPSLTGNVNDSFFNASSAVRLSYDKSRGRHVVANKRLQTGDVLFVERPFIFAPVFVNTDMELSLSNCYNCLRTIYSSIPCVHCTKCLFCNDVCRSSCWEEFHKWECRGMQSNLWYYIGIGFPSLRAVIKGVSTGLHSSTSNDAVRYGDAHNNYLYFNKLLSNICKMENVLPLIVSAAVIVSYLEKYTEFFKWLRQQTTFEEYTSDGLIALIGGRITKHIAQLQCNSSVITHAKCENDSFRSGEEDSVACAIYPSISMMNHSCKPNIMLYYIQQTVVVKAAESIQENEEIFNCYGIDYRCTDRLERQDLCRQLYFFECNCRICKCPELEVI